MNSAPIHDSKFYSKLNEFRQDEKYCDVTLQIEEKVFKCHRVVLASLCEYFDAMFSGNFKESTAENILLHDMDASSFEQVLQFLYTGQILVTCDNLYHLLRASDILNLTEIERYCILHIANREEKNIFANVIDIFSFANLRQKKLLTTVIGQYIGKNFDRLRKEDIFLDVPFDELKILLVDYLKSFVIDDAILDTIFRWIWHSREARKPYFNELIDIVDFENISPQYTKFICTKMMWPDSDVKSITYPSTSISENKLSLYVYLKNSVEKRMEIFSTNKCNGNWSFVSSAQPCPDFMKCVSLDNNNYLYRLDYSRMYDEPIRTTFNVYSSIEMSLSSTSSTLLKSPPLELRSFDMCAAQDRIYLYNRKNFETEPNNRSTLFDENSASHSMYTYNRKFNEWFPIPAMKKRLEFASLAACNELVYLIGGKAYDGSIPSGYMQAYDCRTSDWQELARSNKCYVYSTCCVHKGKIYIYNCDTGMEAYDPVAGKWEIIQVGNHSRPTPRLVSYQNFLCCIYFKQYAGGELNFETYDTVLQKWTILPPILLSDISSVSEYKPSIITDIVVFKSLKH